MANSGSFKDEITWVIVVMPMYGHMEPSVVGLFDDPEEARRKVAALKALGARNVFHVVELSAAQVMAAL